MLYQLVKQNDGRLGITRACQALGVSRAWYRAQPDPVPTRADEELLRKIQDIAKAPRYGYRRVKEALERPPYKMTVNCKKVLRIMRKHGLLVKKRLFKPRTTNSNHGLKKYPNLIKNLVVTRLNQVWVADITYVLADGKFCYLATILDRFSRKCLGWALGRTLEAELALRALDMALKTRKGADLSGCIHHSDGGVQYACNEYTALLGRNGFQISMNEDGDPRENAFAESFFKTVKYEEVYLGEYESFAEAEVSIGRFIEWYNEERLHSSIGYAPPDEFEQQVLKGVVA